MYMYRSRGGKDPLIAERTIDRPVHLF